MVVCFYNAWRRRVVECSAIGPGRPHLPVL